MRLYPPMFFQRIWVKKIYGGFRGAEIKINRSLFTTNLGRSIFGGTIFSAADPFYALLFSQALQRRGFKITVWLKSAQIEYIKPGRTDLHYSIRLSAEMIAEAEKALKLEGKFIKTYPIEIYNTSGELCANALNEIYVRNLEFERSADEQE